MRRAIHHAHPAPETIDIAPSFHPHDFVPMATDKLMASLDMCDVAIELGCTLQHGSIASVYTGPDETMTALTDDGVDELSDMFREARRTTQTWHGFLDDFVDDPELAARFKAQPPR